MWTPVELPVIEGPIRGFTFPERDVLFVFAPRGLIRVGLSPVQVEAVADPATAAAMLESLDPQGRFTSAEGRHFVYSADQGDVTPCDHPHGERIEMDPADGTLLLIDGRQFAINPLQAVVRQRIESIRLPADDASWMFAGFSQDFRWLVSGSPAGIQVFQHRPDANPEDRTERAVGSA